jgi:chemotaxis protein MotA
VSTSATALKESLESRPSSLQRTHQPRKADLSMLAGVAIVMVALIAGIASTGVRPGYFLQPAGMLIVLGGTLGVTLIATPRRGLLYSARQSVELLWTPAVKRGALIEEIVSLIKTARTGGLLGIEPMIAQSSDSFLQESLLLALDVKEREDLQATLETKIRLRERQGEADAKMLEVAGGFAPTIGVIGTVIGLIDVLRQFSDVTGVAYGVGTAFVSTIYGLTLANLVLLPAAHRIRAKVAELFELQELMAEGVLCLFDRIHPALVRERLNCYLREAEQR